MPGRSCWLYLPYPSKGRKVNIVIDGLFMMSATMHLRRQAHRALTTSCFRGSSEVILASRPLVTPPSSRASSRFAATRRSLSAVPSSDDRPLIPGIGRGKTSTGLVCFFIFFDLYPPHLPLRYCLSLRLSAVIAIRVSAWVVIIFMPPPYPAPTPTRSTLLLRHLIIYSNHFVRPCNSPSSRHPLFPRWASPSITTPFPR